MSYLVNKSDKKNNKYQRCTKGLWDNTVPGIKFDEDGTSNYAKMFFEYINRYPRGNKGTMV